MDEIITSAESFCNFECKKCGEPIDVEDPLMSLGGEPFNGVIMECDNKDCNAEYSLDMLIRINEA